MAEEIINIQIVEEVENITISIQEPSKTSDLINDGADGVHPFITSAQTINDASSTVKGILKLTNDLGGTADLPTVPALANKVDKVTGKGLSTNDYTTAEQTKLAGIQTGAEVNVNADWNATIGDAVILNKPTIPSITGLVPYIGATTDVDLGGNNLKVNNIFDGYTSIVASGTQIVLTVNSTPSYLVTGSGGQTIKMPNAITLPNGALYYFNNNQSSGAILVNNNSNTLIKSVPSGGNMILELTDNSTAVGSWDAHFQAPSNVSWSTNTFDVPASITSATWNGVSIADNRIASAATWNAKEDSSNKVTTFTGNETSNTKYPSVKSVYDWAVGVFTTTSAVATQITTALTGYATQTYVNGQGFITNVITALGYTPLNKAGDTITGDFGNTATGYFKLPNGTTAQRPGTPLNGMRRYNTDTLRDEFYANGSWQNHARLTGDTFTGAISATNLTGNNTGDQDLSGLLPKASPSFTGLMTGVGTTQTSTALGILDLSQTWNNAAAILTAIKLNITDTASNAISKLLDIQLNSASIISVYKTITRFNVPIYVGGTATTDTSTSFFVTQGGFSSSGGGTIRDFYSNRGFITTGTASVGINFFEVGGSVTQSVGSTGITRGLYINPTLTNAIDFRAIEVTAGKLVFSSTIISPGTTGAQPIHKISGKVNAAATTTSLVVTNSLVTTSSIVMCQLGTNDATCVIKSVVEAAGSFTIYYTAPTAETVIKFKVIN